MTFRERFFLVTRFVKYWLHAVDEHSLHAPFVFRYYNNVIRPARSAPTLKEVEDIRRQFLKEKRHIEVKDLGAGSHYSNEVQRNIAGIARTALSEQKLVSLMVHHIRYMQAKWVLELGTSLGITTQYLARISDEVKVDSFEGAEELHREATGHLSALPNVTCHLGNIDNVLPSHLEGVKQIDLAYIDANHTYEGTTRYFKLLLPKMHATSVMVIGDIHWSRGMERAWKQIIAHPEVAISMDLFHAGIVFFMPFREKQNYIVRF